MPFDFDAKYDRRNSDSAKWNYFPEDVLPMWVADMDFRSPPAIIEALHARVEEGLFGYSMGEYNVRPVIAARLERLYGWKVDPEAIVALSGLVSGLNVATRAYGEVGDGVLVNTPVYGPFLTAPVNQGRVLQRADQVLTDENGVLSYTVDFDALDAAVNSEDATTRMIILCNPQNPVGAAYSRAELEQFAALAERHDLIICSDEIHCDLLLGDTTHTPIATLSPEIARRTITLMAPSKTFNIPGLGASFAVIEDADLRKRFQTAMTGIVPHMSLLGTVAMEAAYTRCDDWLQELRAYLTANRDFALDYIATHMPGVRHTNPQATYLMWLDFGGKAMDKPATDWLAEHAKVAVNGGTFFGEDRPGFVRLNFGCPRATLAEGLDRIAEAISTL
jgi:cystathionine beta-lyase